MGISPWYKKSPSELVFVTKKIKISPGYSLYAVDTVVIRSDCHIVVLVS
jgi:hypothetical protein